MTGNKYAELTADWGWADFLQHIPRGPIKPIGLFSDLLECYLSENGVWCSERQLAVKFYESRGGQKTMDRDSLEYGGLCRVERMVFSYLMDLERDGTVESRRTGSKKPPFLEWRVR